jgi:ApaG protein
LTRASQGDKLRPIDTAGSLTMYRATTRGIEVSVTPRYLSQRSNPDADHYAFSYRIVIANQSTVTVQLLTRRWIITDALGQVRQVTGEGVVGEQPTLKPGQSFEYTSGVPLPTPSGVMVGSYGMMTPEGDGFDIDVPAFSLDADGALRVLN